MIETTLARVCGASGIRSIDTIQSLWSGYGSLDRYHLIDACCESVIVKHIQLDASNSHPRGWQGERSHQRKLDSYQIEQHWYHDWAETCSRHCRVPACLASQQQDDQIILILEDLDAAGFTVRSEGVTPAQLDSCLSWLANFHATFMGATPDGLWTIGTYWHLDTRPDEWQAMPAGDLKQFAPEIDQILRDAPFQTLVHGDAKLANFCFSEDGTRVAAVDFQYVGGGCGMKDLAYFIGSCFVDSACEQREAELLDRYFGYLHAALRRERPKIDPAQVEAAWRPLFGVAWTDFHRFLKGWSPGHWKIHGYSERISREVIEQLKRGR